MGLLGGRLLHSRPCGLNSNSDAPFLIRSIDKDCLIVNDYLKNTFWKGYGRIIRHVVMGKGNNIY